MRCVMIVKKKYNDKLQNLFSITQKTLPILSMFAPFLQCGMLWQNWNVPIIINKSVYTAL